jgi:hypothetical protein
MAFTPDIPQANQTLASTQQPILENFQGIDVLINVNHVDFDLADQGKHKWVSMPNQGANPTTTATEVAIYSRIDATTTVAELTLRRPSDGTVIPMSATAGTTNGWTMLPSGILMKWGTTNATGSDNINANAFGKAFTTLYSVQLTNNTILSTSDTYVMGGNIVGTTFDVYVGNRTTPGTDATVNVNWLVIGVP